jgi:hypothetical protein
MVCENAIANYVYCIMPSVNCVLDREITTYNVPMFCVYDLVLSSQVAPPVPQSIPSGASRPAVHPKWRHATRAVSTECRMYCRSLPDRTRCVTECCRMLTACTFAVPGEQSTLQK